VNRRCAPENRHNTVCVPRFPETGTRADGKKNERPKAAATWIRRVFGLQPDRRKNSSSPEIRCLSTRSAILSDCTLLTIEAGVVPHLDVHPVTGNYSTHKTSSIKGLFARRPVFQIHFTSPPRRGLFRLNAGSPYLPKRTCAAARGVRRASSKMQVRTRLTATTQLPGRRLE
jgi:hypothetical protein